MPLPFQSIGSVYSGLMQGVGAAEKVFEFIDRQPTMVHDGSLAPDHVDGKVEFRNVTFSYRTRSATQVLQVSPPSTMCCSPSWQEPDPSPWRESAAYQRCVKAGSGRAGKQIKRSSGCLGPAFLTRNEIY